MYVLTETTKFLLEFSFLVAHCPMFKYCNIIQQEIKFNEGDFLTPTMTSITPLKSNYAVNFAPLT